MEKKFVYNQPGHLSSLESMRLQGVLCDVTIHADDAKFQAHKFILAATTQYFANMFLGDFQESKKEIISIKDVSATNMGALITFAYTGQITVTEGNVLSLVKDADYFGLAGLKEAGLKFVESCLNIQNIYEVYCFAETLNDTALSEACKNFIQNHFGGISLADVHVEFDIELLINVLSSDKLKVPSKDIFEAIMKWILNDIDDRNIHLSKLLGFIRLSDLSSDFLMDYLIKEEFTAKASKYHSQLMIQIMSLYKNDKKNFLKNHQQSIIATSRYDTKNFEIYNPMSGTWESFITPEYIFGYLSRVIVHRDKLYGFGDSKIKTYDLKNKICGEISPMNSTRIYCGATVLNDFVYVCGGHTHVAVTSSTVERYCTETNKWEALSPMNISRIFLEVVAFQGCIYAIGGAISKLHYSEPIDTVERYDPQKNQWTVLNSRMNRRRQEFGTAVLNGKIYVCGGITKKYVRLNSVERYDPETDRWEYVASMNTPRCDFSVVAHMGKLWAVGGYNEENGNLSTVEVYDPVSNSWSFAPSMNNISGPAAGAVVSSW